MASEVSATPSPTLREMATPAAYAVLMGVTIMPF